MEADGLHPQRVLHISRALDGDAMTELFDRSGAGNEEERRTLRDVLLALTEENTPLV
jgi:hypothetical protein